MGFLSRLLGKGKSESKSEPSAEQVTHNGYLIQPAPMKQKGTYFTAGYIYKDDESGVRKEHYFIRADTHTDYESACQHAVFKAKHIIRESGDRIFSR